MADTNLFGIQNPFNKEIGYTCVLGNAGNVFGLVVYLGSKGFDQYRQIESEEMDEELGCFLDSLTLIFSNNKSIPPESKDLLRQLGFDIKEKEEWALFRKLEVGFPPRSFNQEEIRYFTLVLQETLQICERFKENPNLFSPPQESHYLVRMIQEGKGDFSFSDHWIKPEVYEEKFGHRDPLDEILLQELKKNLPIFGDYEFEATFIPFLIKVGKQEVYPFGFIFVDRYTEWAFCPHFEEYSSFCKKAENILLHIFQKNEVIPKRIFYNKHSLLEILQPLANQLGIQLEFCKQLEVIKKFKKTMIQDFFKQKPWA